MKKLDDRDETVVLNTKIPAALGDRIRSLQRDEKLSSKSEAVRVVLERGLMEMGEGMVPLIEFAEGQRALLTARGWSDEAAAAHAYLVLCDLRAQYFATFARSAETNELRTRKTEGLLS